MAHDPLDALAFGLWGQKYRDYTDKHGEAFLSCVICGRDTSKRGNSQGVAVSGGGGLIIHPDDYPTYPHNGGDMGWFPVGSECIKAIPKGYRIGNPYRDKERGV